MAHEIGRIESEIILGHIKNLKQKIVLQYISSRFDVIVESVVGTQLCVRRTQPADDLLLVGRLVQLFFHHQDTKMTIMPRVVRDWGEKIELTIERPAYRDVERTFERVYNAPSVDVSVLAAEDRDGTQYPRTVRPPATGAQRTQGLPQDMQALVQSFLQTFQKQNMLAKIVMFRDRPPQHHAERICSYVGYPLIIPYPPADYDLAIASRESIVDAMRACNISPTAPDALLTAADRVPIPDAPLPDAQIMAPIRYSTYAVGYLLVGTRLLESAGYRVCINVLERYSATFSQVLAKNDYFKNLTHLKQNKRPVRLVDLSATGLRFSYKGERQNYTPASTIKLVLAIRTSSAPKEFYVSAFVVHHQVHNQLHYVSVQFTNPDAAFSTFITKYLYGM